MSRITKIQQNSFDGNGKIYNIGATFDNVFLDKDDGFTLKDLYDKLKSFFNNDNASFMMYSKEEPKNDHVKVWYEISE